MAKRELSQDYRAGAQAFMVLCDIWREGDFDSSATDFRRIAHDTRAAVRGKSDEFRAGFEEASALVIEKAITGSSSSHDWNAFRDLEDPDWWRDENAIEARAQTREVNHD
ncbi:hypothetical protein [Burkholderia gladioli]|uniref:hypothetical protein n=1 Tax=Burkholderia gladioli TaxID=28095 RepID=UPI00163F0953|nr:hypothetical protein [Burkholderia gladioli]